MQRELEPAAPALWLALIVSPLRAEDWDSSLGKEVLYTYGCIDCHSGQGLGGDAATDLSRRPIRRLTPAVMTALLWNHGPAMWQAMAEKGSEVPQLTEQDIRHLYAYFYSLSYFDPLGDAGRGKRVFASQKCFRCHALIETEVQAKGPSVRKWSALSDPVSWVKSMWNHGAAMSDEMRQEGIDWPHFEVQEMVDLLVFLRNRPESDPIEFRLKFGDLSSGQDLFASKRCAECHSEERTERGKVNLRYFGQESHSLAELAAAMWNHRPLMEKRAAAKHIDLPSFEDDQMARLLGYLLTTRYFNGTGSPKRGERVFRKKGCAACHSEGGVAVPKLAATSVPAARLTAAVWRHGPEMLARMKQKNLAWPTLTGRDIRDLTAYFSLNEAQNGCR